MADVADDGPVRWQQAIECREQGTYIDSPAVALVVEVIGRAGVFAVRVDAYECNAVILKTLDRGAGHFI